MTAHQIEPRMLVRNGRNFTLVAGRAAGGEAPDAKPNPMRRLVRFASRRRWVLLGGVTAGILVGLGVTLLMTRQYASTTRLEISRLNARVVNIDSVERETSIGDQEFYQTQYGLLRTQVLAERVVRDLGVADQPSFYRMFGRRDVFKSDGVASGKYDQAKRSEIAGQLLLKRVSVAPVRGSSLIDVKATTPDAQLSKKIAQTWCEDFIATNLERRFDSSSYARHFLETRIEELRDKLETSERDAVDYADRQGIINLPSSADQSASGGAGPTGTRSLVTDDLSALNGALEAATADRIKAQSQLLEAKRPDASSEALGNEAIGLLREKRADIAGEYAKQLEQFEPNYPAAKALFSQREALDQAIAQEEDRVRTSLERAYDSASAREKALIQRVDSLKTNLVDLRRRSIQYNIFQRDADSNRDLYNTLLQRYKEIGISGGVENNNVAIVDSAKVADRPASPNLLLNVILAMLAGAAAGAMVAGGLDQFDEGIADPGEVESKLGLPLLGVVPRAATASPLSELRSPRSKLVEAYLAVQANLELSATGGTPRSLAIISTRPKEGKSTTAIALAQSLARAGRKVVLVDADMRSPTIHSAFRLANLTGVSSFLSGTDTVEPGPIATDLEGLSVMTAGPQPSNAGELLMGERLASIVKHLLERFDHVIVDSPPMIGLADAPLVASAVDAVVYVVEAGSVPISAVRIALNRLRTGQSNTLGAVLTKFEAKRAHLSYGYDYDYAGELKSAG